MKNQQKKKQTKWTIVVQAQHQTRRIPAQFQPHQIPQPRPRLKKAQKSHQKSCSTSKNPQKKKILSLPSSVEGGRDSALPLLVTMETLNFFF
jgi:hypothetical protein